MNWRFTEPRKIKTIGGSIKTNTPSSVNIILCHACDPFLGKMEKAYVNGWQVSYRNGCQSVILWQERRPLQQTVVSKTYLNFKKLAFRVIIVLDNGLGHRQDHDHTNPNTQVGCLSKNTISLLQPLKQGIITTFKHYHIHSTFWRL